MYTWSPYPFLRITTAFILGLIVYRYFPQHLALKTSLITISVLFFIYLVIYLLPRKQNIILGNIGLIIISCLGYLNADLYDESNNSNHLIYNKENIKGYSALTNSSVIEKDKYYIYDVIVKEIVTNDSIISKTGIIKLYIKRTENDTAFLKYGDKILVRGKPFRLPPPGNPNEFNYMQYMAGQNIYFQQFAEVGDIKIISNKPKFIFMAWANNWRVYFSNKIDEYILNKNESAIAKALILGVKDGLDNKIKSSYASAGAMHVLAVSGLHAGIIFMILQYLFSFFIKTKPWNVILPIFLIAFLWAFAMITGLSPSIMRAVTMFTIIILGQYFFSRPNIFNSLSLSAIILLIYNPNFLFSVGFQLSYIAVAGIVYLFPIIYNLYTTKHSFIDQVWTITSVSISAQIATFPLTIYYFHQFPTYFLLSNLIVIPAAFIIMSLGLVLLLFSEIFFVSDLLGFILESIIQMLNSFVFYIQELNMSLIEWLYIDWTQMIAIYGIIFSVLLLMHYRKMIFMKLILACVIVIAMKGTYRVHQQSISEKLIFYEIKNQSIIDIISGFKAEIFSVNSIEDLELVKYQIDPNRLVNNLKPVDANSSHTLPNLLKIKGMKLLIWKDKRLLFITEKIDGIKMKSPIQCDILIISNNSINRLSQIKSIVIYNEIIIDNTNDYFTRKKIIKDAEKLNIKCRSTVDDGAIIIES